jgi:hypothetical protein
MESRGLHITHYLLAVFVDHKVQLLNSVFMISRIIKDSVPVTNITFGSTDNTYFNLDNSGYHKNLIQ